MQLMMQMIAVSIHPHPPQNPFYSRLTAPVGTNTLPEPGAETRPEVGLRVCGRPSACTFSQRLGNRSTSPLRPLPRLLLGRNLPAPISITGLSLPLRFEVLFPPGAPPAGSLWGAPRFARFTIVLMERMTLLQGTCRSSVRKSEFTLQISSRHLDPFHLLFASLVCPKCGSW